MVVVANMRAGKRGELVAAVEAMDADPLAVPPKFCDAWRSAVTLDPFAPEFDACDSGRKSLLAGLAEADQIKYMVRIAVRRCVELSCSAFQASDLPADPGAGSLAHP
jgi:hypothetical protein